MWEHQLKNGKAVSGEGSPPDNTLFCEKCHEKKELYNVLYLCEYKVADSVWGKLVGKALCKRCAFIEKLSSEGIIRSWDIVKI